MKLDWSRCNMLVLLRLFLTLRCWSFYTSMTVWKSLLCLMLFMRDCKASGLPYAIVPSPPNWNCKLLLVNWLAGE